MTTTMQTKSGRHFARTPKADPKFGAGEGAAEQDNALQAGETTAAEPVATPKPESKIARVLTLLERKGGATLGDLVSATGWLPHTTRAALTGLRKKGHTFEKNKVDGVTHYSIVTA